MLYPQSKDLSPSQEFSLFPDTGEFQADTASMPPAATLATGFSVVPDIRISLGSTAREIHISAHTAFYVQARSESTRRQVQGDIQIRLTRENQAVKTAQPVPKPQMSDELKPVYQIQVASFLQPENALGFRDSLEVKFDVPVSIQLNSVLGMNRVCIGEFSTREEARSYLPTVRLDYPNAFIVSGETASGGETVSDIETAEAAAKSSGADYVRKLLGIADGDKIVVTLSGMNDLSFSNPYGFRIYPSAASAFLSVNGKAYRGFLDIFPNKSGSLTLVNQLAIEDYLLSVVPSEMNPNTYPESAALAALAIAARTNTVKNMGHRYSDGFDLSNGYDLTDDMRTQVYGGVAAENPVTSDIVLRTAGLVIYHDDQPIDAIYMSTCGGRTEDFGLVFGTNSIPYLQSVFCAIEHGYEAEGVVLEGTNDMTGIFRTADIFPANRNIELARVIGLIPPAASDTVPLASPVGANEARRLIDTAAAIIKSSRRVPVSPAEIAMRGGFLHHAADVFFGGSEIQRRISRADENYYMASLMDGAAVPEALRQTIAFLMQRKLLRPTAGNVVDVRAPMRRGDAITLLISWIEAERPDILRRGVFVDAGRHKDGAPNILNIKIGGIEREFELARNPHLFRVDPERQITPVREIKLIGAEKLAFYLNDKNEIDFLEIELSPSGAASDRLSFATTWQAKLTRADAAEILSGLTSDIGTFMDLQPHRFGYSGRAVQIQAIGSRGKTMLNGYKVRNALGLSDTLFTLTREFDADGDVTAFNFSGRGFGHGIGLCQTGAYGMAKAGRSYTEILKTYYTGVEIKKAY